MHSIRLVLKFYLQPKLSLDPGDTFSTPDLGQFAQPWFHTQTHQLVYLESLFQLYRVLSAYLSASYRFRRMGGLQSRDMFKAW